MVLALQRRVHSGNMGWLKCPTRRRERNANRLEHPAACAEASASNRQMLSVFPDDGLLEGFKILLDIGPLKSMPSGFESSVQFLKENQQI